MSTEELLEAYKAALEFSDLNFYEDFNTHDWPASSIADVIYHTREKLGTHIDYDALRDEDWNNPVKRLGFALLVSKTAHPFSPLGIRKFERYCREVNDQVALDEIESVLLDLEEV